MKIKVSELKKIIKEEAAIAHKAKVLKEVRQLIESLDLDKMIMSAVWNDPQLMTALKQVVMTNDEARKDVADALRDALLGVVEEYKQDSE